MIVDYRVAPCLDVILGQINRAAPNRSKASDGSIGDPSHQTRESDHNPWVYLRSMFWVTARDFTHDPGLLGLDCDLLYQDLVASRDPRIKYIIWNDQITAGARGPAPWVPREYEGPNEHRKHLHLSVVPDERLFKIDAWTLSLKKDGFAEPIPTNPPAGRRNLSEGMIGNDVRALQTFTNKNFPAYSKLVVDGRYGPATKAVIMEFQRRSNLAPDGIVGPQTYVALRIHGFR